MCQLLFLQVHVLILLLILLSLVFIHWELLMSVLGCVSSLFVLLFVIMKPTPLWPGVSPLRHNKSPFSFSTLAWPILLTSLRPNMSNFISSSAFANYSVLSARTLRVAYVFLVAYLPCMFFRLCVGAVYVVDPRGRAGQFTLWSLIRIFW